MIARSTLAPRYTFFVHLQHDLPGLSVGCVPDSELLVHRKGRGRADVSKRDERNGVHDVVAPQPTLAFTSG